MSDEEDGKPFQGARGPRKTRPKKTKKEKADEQAVVRELFPEKRQEQPGLVMPDRKKSKRARIQIGSGWTAAMDKMVADGMTMKDFVALLSPEELSRGQLKNPAGQFVGAPPKWVPAEFHKECIRELMRRGKTMYQESYLEAIQTMLTVANSPSVEPAQRIKAAQFVIERIEGKVPEKLEIGVSEPWQELLTGIVATVDSGAPMRTFNEAGDTSGD